MSGRLLHQFLEVGTQYTKWFERMSEYGFTENQDYTAISQKRLTAQGNETTFTDHAIKIDMAKEISMLQRSDRGKQARQYFIQLEKNWNSPEKVMARALVIAHKTIAILQPKADVYDAFADLDHTVGLRDFAKEVGVREGTLRKWLLGNGYVYMQAYTSKGKEKRRMKPTSNSVANGWMVMRDIKSADGYTGTQVRFTMEGKKKLLIALREQGVA